MLELKLNEAVLKRLLYHKFLPKIYDIKDIF